MLIGLNMAEIDMLINARKYRRRLVTELYNKSDQFDTWQFIAIDESLQACIDYRTKLDELNNKIQSLRFVAGFSEEDLENELESCENYDLRIRLCTIKLNQCKIDRQIPRNDGTANVTNRSLLKCPTAPLPTYHSMPNEDLTRFFAQFEETIDRYNYPEYDKLLLLKQQLSGRALTLVNSLEADKQGYSHAKQLLEKALASPDIQKFNVIRQLTQLNMKDHSDPFEYISRMRVISESIKNLKIDIEFVQQYFVWNGMTETFKNHMIQITNKSKPNFMEINDSIFQASERFMESRSDDFPVVTNDSKGKVSEKSAYAAPINYDNSSQVGNFKSCSICSSYEKRDASHPIFRCEKFRNAKEKIAELVKLGFCLKCGNNTHKTSFCKYKFRNKCKFCGQWHFSFLCDKDSTPKKTFEAKSRVTKPDREVSNNVAAVEVWQSMANSECILPTFTVNINGMMVRCLKDGGCQTNLIDSNIARKFDLPIVRDISLKINGINNSRNYNTKVVRLNIDIGGELFDLEAIVLPSIDINLRLPGLSKVVRSFKNRYYEMADKMLSDQSDEIGNISIIIGTKSAHCLPVKDVLFGSNKCIYSQTPIGVMLQGDIDQILENSQSLSRNYEFSSYSTNVSNIDDSDEKYYIDTSFNVNLKDKFLHETASKAAQDILDRNCANIINYDCVEYEENSTKLNDELVQYAIDHTTRNDDGRLIMPLLWNKEMSHLLAKNDKLSRQILNSNLKKYGKDIDKLKMIDNVIHEQEKANIVERIDNEKEFLSNYPNHSFLPHMPIFRPDKDTTKCRIVFLSNLCEKSRGSDQFISHNQALYSGPSLNNKITVALLHLRFGKFVLCFDIKKAFNNILLYEEDQNRLLFYWFRDVSKGDFSVQLFRNIRLSFGLRTSPFLLMLALYKILVLDALNDPKDLKLLKKQIYHYAYMDNCAFTLETSEALERAFSSLNGIFEPYQFGLQQYLTNDLKLQDKIDRDNDVKTSNEVKLLGMNWNRSKDCLSTMSIELDTNASTKRSILSTLASQYDIFGTNIPVMNRSKLFMHKLQKSKNIDWDTNLSSDLKREWKNIASQANSSPKFELNRFVGNKDDSYNIICCSDSSKEIYGAVCYIQNVKTGDINYLMAKNRLVNKQLESKSIPALEIQGIALGAEMTIDIYNSLTSGAVCPVNIVKLYVYTDSYVALTWLNSYINTLDKMRNISNFVMNRLHAIKKCCDINPIEFSFVSGTDNPADCATRCVSGKLLLKTNYFAGPSFLDNSFSSVHSRDDLLRVIIPNPLGKKVEVNCNFLSFVESDFINNIINKYSSFRKLVQVFSCVLKCKDKWKSKIGKHFTKDCSNYHLEATNILIRNEQSRYFPEVFNYFSSDDRNIKDIPPLVSRLNLYVSSDDLLRVKSKFERFDRNSLGKFPIILPKESKLTNLLIVQYHEDFLHVGCYALLAELRKFYYINHYFSTVKKIVKSCITCGRFKNRVIKLNQSSYKEWRVEAPEIPFAYLFMDHLGPFSVRDGKEKIKVWLLCFTCIWSRAINVKICYNLSVSEFLRAFQLHCFDFGLPQYCFSDLGSQLVAGGKIIENIIEDPEAKSYFDSLRLKFVKFNQFAKGKSELGSMVEVCVKALKKLIYSSIKTNILTNREFEFLICEVIHIVNRRPVALKEVLRDKDLDVPEAITPELLLRGYSLTSVNIMPDNNIDLNDPDFENENVSDKVVSISEKLQRVRLNMIERYNSEFLSTLIYQAINQKDRFKPVNSRVIKRGDIVLLKENFTKPVNYPMARVLSVEINNLGEITEASLLKGRSREVVRRHASAIIPLLESDIPGRDESKVEILQDTSAKVQRTCAKETIRLNRKLAESHLV